MALNLIFKGLLASTDSGGCSADLVRGVLLVVVVGHIASRLFTLDDDDTAGGGGTDDIIGVMSSSTGLSHRCWKGHGGEGGLPPSIADGSFRPFWPP